MLQTSKRAAIRNKQLETEEPLVKKVIWILEYLEMLNNIENDTEIQNLPLDSEKRQLLVLRNRMPVVTLDAGTRLIVKDESEILIPRILRRQMLEICIIHIVQMKRC